MCGIAGVLSTNGAAVERSHLEAMAATLHHRGPDERGYFVEGPVGFAHTRLSIIDLSSGQQPMSNRDGSVWLCYNGEVFNYLELKKELEDGGRRFFTTSDTEVVLQLYEEHGDSFLSRMNGQFALSIWDRKRQRLLCARDRLGIRPLYYAQPAGSFVFGSEIKALFAHPAVHRAIDPLGLDEIFSFWCTQAPRTAYEGVHDLPPGCYLTVEKGTVSVRKYWSLDYSDPLTITDEEAGDQVLSLLTESTRLRLRSDVPVGVYVSGGIDSSVTAALAVRASSYPLESYSLGFTVSELDESPFQREVATRLGTTHHEVRCSPADIGRVFPEVIAHAEQPILRTAPAPLFLLSQLVRKNDKKVVLTGEGADEILGGYDIFKEAKIRRFWSRFPDSKSRPLLLRRLYPYMKSIQAQPEAYLKAFFHVRSEDLDNPFFSHLPRWRLTEKTKLFFSPRVKAAIERAGSSHAQDRLAASLPEAFDSWGHFAQAQYLESILLLPGYILSSQGDRMTMGNSVEGRFPFLDHHLVELAARLPAHTKMKVLDEKHVLKRAAKGLVPESVLRRKKQPYRAPDAISFFDPDKQCARFEYVDELLSETALEKTNLFSPAPVQKLVAKAKSGRVVGVQDNMALVGILSTQLACHELLEM